LVARNQSVHYDTAEKIKSPDRKKGA